MYKGMFRVDCSHVRYQRHCLFSVRNISEQERKEGVNWLHLENIEGQSGALWTSKMGQCNFRVGFEGTVEVGNTTWGSVGSLWSAGYNKGIRGVSAPQVKEKDGFQHLLGNPESTRPARLAQAFELGFETTQAAQGGDWISNHCTSGTRFRSFCVSRSTSTWT